MSWVITKWERIIDEKGNFVKYSSKGVGVSPQKTDLNMYKIVKVKNNWSCSVCNKKLPQGSWVIGRDNWKLCLNCGLEMWENSIGTFKELIKDIQKTKRYLEKNKDRLNAENIISSL